MGKKTYHIIVVIVFIFLCENAFSAYYWTSEEFWGEQVSNFTTETENIYCNVLNSKWPTEVLKWFDPYGNEVDRGTSITWIFKYINATHVGHSGFLVVSGKGRPPGQWQIKHYGEVVAQFTIVPAPHISISPPYFETLEVVGSFDTPGSDPDGLAFDGTYLWHANPHLMVGKIYKLDTSGNTLDSFDSPGIILQDLHLMAHIYGALIGGT